MEFILLITGLAGLWLGTEATIRGAVGLAERFRLSEFVVGVAILSIGSDLPELAVAVDAALKNLPIQQISDVVVGSAVGSALAQIGLVLGIAALLQHLTLPRETIYRHGAMLLVSIILLALFALDELISATEGVALVTVYSIYLVMLFTNGLANSSDTHSRLSGNLALCLAFLVVGLAILTGSAELTVSSATKMAAEFGIEQSLIAILLIGLGTSLPELSISVVAAAKGRAHLSIGNLIGSNIFDTLVPIGVAATIAKLGFDDALLWFELPVLFVLSAVVLWFLKHEQGIRKRRAFIILAIYIGYAAVKLAQM
jgi:cation:H+ antiporter